LRSHIDRALAGEQFEFEECVSYPAGERHMHAAIVPRFQEERVIGYLSLITDVSDRVRAQEQLQASERQFREMADTAPVALWLTDPAGACTFLSREWYELTGQTEAEALGLGWTTATHPEDEQRPRNVPIGVPPADAGRFIPMDDRRGTPAVFRARRVPGDGRCGL
jgi:PAS domain-containing protein